MLFNASCNNEEPDTCADCDAAMENLKTEINNSKCKLENVEEAVESVKKACGDTKEVLAGIYYMAECCALDEKVIGTSCNSTFTGYIKCPIYLSNPPNHRLKQTVKVRYLSGDGKFYDLEPTQDVLIKPDLFHGEGDSLEFALFSSSQKFIMTKRVGFTYIRPGKVFNPRFVEIRESVTGELDIAFVNWN